MNAGPGRAVRRRLAVLGLVAGLWMGLHHEPRRTGTAADTAAVYKVLLADLRHAAPIWHPLRIIQSRPERPWTIVGSIAADTAHRRFVAQEVAGIQDATWADFVRQLADTTSIRPVLPRARLVPLDPSVSPRQAGYIGEALLSAPVHGFSRAGFNANRTQALVFASYRCGGLCGDGQVVLLERRGRRWRIAGTALVWIS